MREAEGVAVTLEQSRKRERALEEEGRRLKEEQADTLRLLKELQGEEQTLGRYLRFVTGTIVDLTFVSST